MATNLLAMPLIHATIETGNNEDWIDSLLFVVDDGSSSNPEDLPQLDLRGITFEMEVRRTGSDPEVIIAASTLDGTLQIGAPPNVGFLLFAIPVADTQSIRAGKYVADVIGRDQYNIRVVMTIELTIVEGVTKQPVNQRIVVQAAA